MAKHCSHSIEFKRQVAQQYLGGETIHTLAKRHDVSLATSEPKRPELETIKIGRELREGGIDPPLTPQAKSAALPARAARIGQQAVAEQYQRHVAFDHFDRNIGVVVHAERVSRRAIAIRQRPGTDT